MATLGIGYADGVERLLARTGDARVLLGGRRVSVVGLVTMDLTIVDVGDAPVALGDVATLIGSAAGSSITLAEFAGWSDVVQWEVLVRLGARLPRLYK